jgi:hypothetical protein
MSLDDLLANAPIEPPSLTGATGRKCSRHQWYLADGGFGIPPAYVCRSCNVIRDEARAKRGRQSRNYGNRAELAVARKYGGTKIGHAGGPVDVRGKDFATQVKTHRRKPPIEWTKSFAGMSNDTRCPRLLLRFVQGPGLLPLDYFVFPADEFLAWFGRDEDAA